MRRVQLHSGIRRRSFKGGAGTTTGRSVALAAIQRRAALIACMFFLAMVAALAGADRAAAAPTFLTPLIMSDAGADATEPELDVSNGGATIVVWTRFTGSSSRVQARHRDAAGNLGAVEFLSAGGLNASDPDVAFDSSGNAIAVWTLFDGTNNRIQAAFRPAAGPWQSAVTLSATGGDGDDPQISFDSAGNALAVWSRFGPPGSAVVQASIRPPSGSFGAVQDLSIPGQEAFEARASAGPSVDDNAAVCWTRSDGSGLNSLRVQCSRRRDVGGFPRSKAATPLYAPLVTAYNTCSSPNRVHASPLNFGSCTPPTRSSAVLTSGSPDANGFAANLTGAVKMVVQNGNPGTVADEADVSIDINIADVRNNPSGTDYTGRVLAMTSITMTDKRADAQENPTPGTTQPFDLGIPVQCTATGVTTIGSSCTLATTVDSLVPGAVVESVRSSWELGQFVVKDAGPNGTGYGAGCPFTCGDGDEGTFLRQGIFIP
jgi:hypothetical protein